MMSKILLIFNGVAVIATVFIVAALLFFFILSLREQLVFKEKTIELKSRNATLEDCVGKLFDVSFRTIPVATLVGLMTVMSDNLKIIMYSCLVITIISIAFCFYSIEIGFNTEKYICQNIPMKQLLNADIRYCIAEECKRVFNLKEIKIENKEGCHSWVYPYEEDVWSVNDLLDQIKCANTIILVGRFKDCEKMKEVIVDKSILYDFVGEKKQEAKLNKEKWKIDIPLRTILIRNDYVPDCYLRIADRADSDKILELIANMQPKEINKIILGRKAIEDINGKIADAINSGYTVVRAGNDDISENAWKILLEGIGADEDKAGEPEKRRKRKSRKRYFD